MVSIVYANAMSEVLEYLKGIREEDLKKISPKFMKLLEENASKEYNPNIDYTRALVDLNLMDTSKAIISFICYKYWCENDKQKKDFLNVLNENEKKFEEQWKYINDNMFKSKKTMENNETIEENKLPIEIPEHIGLFERIKRFFKKILKKK